MERRTESIQIKGSLISIDDIDSMVEIVKVDRSQLDVIFNLNVAIFGEERIINTLDRDDLLILLARVEEKPVGFKIGYKENRFVFYSAKGGVLAEYRRMGLARLMLDRMLDYVREKGYTRFAFDTFPNRHPGMTILALKEGFRVVKADFNPAYKDYRLRFEKKLLGDITLE